MRVTVLVRTVVDVSVVGDWARARAGRAAMANRENFILILGLGVAVFGASLRTSYPSVA